ncbi:MAG TPA: hypothetical protein VIM41_00815 [Gammaproteobacteria bacterium]
MLLTTLDLAKARFNASAILDELRLDAYIYEVEPHDGDWELKIECACDVDGGWEMITLKVPKDMLLDSDHVHSAKESLYAYWKQKLDCCKLRKS